MAKRFLQIEISRKVCSAIAIVVDDEDEKDAKLFGLNGKLNSSGLRSLIEDVHEAANDLDSTDWDQDNDETRIEGLKELSENEAKHYSIWNRETKEHS